ncbi:hypothetical protein B0H10DRAFT_2064811, partial [Mycena sp. CBHHK59/15]
MTRRRVREGGRTKGKDSRERCGRMKRVRTRTSRAREAGEGKERNLESRNRKKNRTPNAHPPRSPFASPFLYTSRTPSPSAESSYSADGGVVSWMKRSRAGGRVAPH